VQVSSAEFCSIGTESESQRKRQLFWHLFMFSFRFLQAIITLR